MDVWTTNVDVDIGGSVCVCVCVLDSCQLQGFLKFFISQSFLTWMVNRVITNERGIGFLSGALRWFSNFPIFVRVAARVLHTSLCESNFTFEESSAMYLLTLDSVTELCSLLSNNTDNGQVNVQVAQKLKL